MHWDCNSRASGCLPCSDKGKYGDCSAFDLAGLKEVCDGGFGFIQPSGRRLGSESCLRVVVGVVALVLKIKEKVDESLGVD